MNVAILPRLLVWCVLFVHASVAHAIDFDVERSPLTPELHERVVSVMHDYYNFDFETALDKAAELHAEYPDDPIGSFLTAEIYFWRVVNNADDPALYTSFLEYEERVIELCKRRLDRDKRDKLALFFMGGALGRKAILSALLGDHMEAVQASLNGRKHIKRLHKYHKDADDAYFGLGLYDYYASQLPWFARILGKLLLGLGGNQERGVQELERAAEHGLFTQVEARLFLAIIYLDEEGRYDDAIRLLRELHATYPGNLNYYGLLGFAYRSRQDFASSLEILREMDELATTSPLFGRRSRAMSLYFLGSTYKVAGLFPQALEALDRALAVDDNGTYNWLRTYALLERGRVHDVLGNREMALRDYAQVLELNDFRGSHDKAEAMTATAYQVPPEEAAAHMTATSLGVVEADRAANPD